jgi:hypothetical protein
VEKIFVECQGAHANHMRGEIIDQPSQRLVIVKIDGLD